jgi:hypothetical protein
MKNLMRWDEEKRSVDDNGFFGEKLVNEEIGTVDF